MSRIVLVTGAAQGIGLAITRRFVENGDRVIATDFNPAGIGPVTEIGASFFQQDVSSEADWLTLLEHIEQEFGGLQVLINNAGTDGKPGLARDPVGTPLEDWEFVFATNCRGTFLGCKHTIPTIARAGGGAIVNLSSVAAVIPTPFLTAYGASKAAVAHLTRTVALHCAETALKIRCNCIHPGQVRTPMLEELFERMAQETGTSQTDFEERFLAEVPLGEFQKPGDIADAALFLAGDGARMITGQALAVDGGFLLKH